MLGKFQQSHIRIEVEADSKKIKSSLLQVSKLRQWLWSQQLATNLSDTLYTGLSFTSWAGLVSIQHQVQIADDHCLRMLLSQGIDGYHEWYWGDGWIQSRLEGISLLPLNLGQTLSLFSLKQFLKSQNP